MFIFWIFAKTLAHLRHWKFLFSSKSPLLKRTLDHFFVVVYFFQSLLRIFVKFASFFKIGAFKGLFCNLIWIFDKTLANVRLIYLFLPKWLLSLCCLIRIFAKLSGKFSPFWPLLPTRAFLRDISPFFLPGISRTNVMSSSRVVC